MYATSACTNKDGDRRQQTTSKDLPDCVFILYLASFYLSGWQHDQLGTVCGDQGSNFLLIVASDRPGLTKHSCYSFVCVISPVFALKLVCSHYISHHLAVSYVIFLFLQHKHSGVFFALVLRGNEVPHPSVSNVIIITFLFFLNASHISGGVWCKTGERVKVMSGDSKVKGWCGRWERHAPTERKEKKDLCVCVCKGDSWQGSQGFKWKVCQALCYLCVFSYLISFPSCLSDRNKLTGIMVQVCPFLPPHVNKLKTRNVFFRATWVRVPNPLTRYGGELLPNGGLSAGGIPILFIIKNVVVMVFVIARKLAGQSFTGCDHMTLLCSINAS